MVRSQRGALPTRELDGVRYSLFTPPEEETSVDCCVVLLHGLGNSLDYWAGVAPALGKRVTTIALDIPGFGGSRDPRAGFHLDEITKDIDGFLTRMGITRRLLVAHSLGACVGLSLIALPGACVGRLVLISGTLQSAGRLLRRPLLGLFEPRLALAAGAQFFGGAVPQSDLLASLASSRIGRRMVLGSFVARPSDLDPELTFAALRGNAGRNMLRTAIEARRVDLAMLMHASTVPTDLLWGDRDPLIRAEDVREAQRLMKIERSERLPNCGHWPLLEQPEKVVDFVLSAPAC
jgi:pimeloyl-ACP methyl ester carboxylesterase